MIDSLLLRAEAEMLLLWRGKWRPICMMAATFMQLILVVQVIEDDARLPGPAKCNPRDVRFVWLSLATTVTTVNAAIQSVFL